MPAQGSAERSSVRRLLASVATAALVGAFLVSAPTAAQAAPPTATWTGAAGGDTAGVTVDVANGGLKLTNAALASSRADTSSQTTPRSTARSSNVDATAAGVLGVSALFDQANAGPAAGTDTDGGTLAAVSALGVGVRALTTADSATWAGDNACVTSGLLASARTATAGTGSTDGVSVNLAGLSLLSTGASSTQGTTALVRNGASGFNYGIRSTATGTIATTCSSTPHHGA